MDRVPQSLAVIGAGKRGVEFATIFASFGSEVTLVEAEGRILPGLDREISVRYRRVLTAKKIEIHTGVHVAAIYMDGRRLRLSLEGPKGTKILTAEKVLYAGARKPELEGLGIDKINLPLRGGFMSVNSQMETSVRGIYAVGDMVGRGCYAHKAYAEAAVAVDNITGRPTAVDYRLIPRVIYTDPEVASIGLTEVEAQGERRRLRWESSPSWAVENPLPRVRRRESSRSSWGGNMGRYWAFTSSGLMAAS